MESKMKRKMNNQGITLIEILVAIAIVAIVSIPFLNSFATGMRINNKAKYTADAQAAAQSMVESLKTMSMEEIITNYGDGPYEAGKEHYTSTNRFGKADALGKYYVEGAGGQKFYMTAEFQATDDLNFYANNAAIPVMTDLSGSDSILLYEKYTKNDGGLLTTDRKVSEIQIKCGYTDVTSDEYKIVVSICTYKDAINPDNQIGDEVVVKQLVVKEDEELPYLYLIPTFFDSTGGADGYSSDKIQISYSYDSSKAGGRKEKMVHFYLVEQAVKNVAGMQVHLKDSNITYKINGIQATGSNHYPCNTALKLYSNIGEGNASNRFGNSVVSGLGDAEKKCADGKNYTFNALTGNTTTEKQIYQLKITVKDGADATASTVTTIVTSLTR